MGAEHATAGLDHSRPSDRHAAVPTGDPVSLPEGGDELALSRADRGLALRAAALNTAGTLSAVAHSTATGTIDRQVGQRTRARSIMRDSKEALL